MTPEGCISIEIRPRKTNLSQGAHMQEVIKSIQSVEELISLGI
jgi:hypothetical protein